MNLRLSKWQIFMKKFLTLLLACIIGFTLLACGSDNEEQKNDVVYPPASEGGNQTEVVPPVTDGGEETVVVPPADVVVESLVYRLEYAETYSEDIPFEYKRQFDSYIAKIDDLTGAIAIEIYLNGELLSTEGLTLSGVGSDASSHIYQGTDKSILAIGDYNLDDVTIEYNHEYKTLAVTSKEIVVEVAVNLTYEVYAGLNLVDSGTAVVGDGGSYYFDVTLGEFSRVDIRCNGQVVSAANTEVTGAFKNQVQATWTKDFYLDELDESRFVYFLDTENTYTFVYTPASTGSAKLDIQWHEPVIDDEGLVVKNVQHSTFEVSQEGDVYTITFSGSAAYSGIQLFFDGVELQPSNANPSGEAYFADWGTLNNTSSKLGFYYQPDDGQSAPGWFSINPGTLVIVYNATNNTLVISYN